MASSQSPFDVLGISPEAELEVVAAAYRALARKYHPDMNPGIPQAELNRRMARLNWAKEELERDLAGWRLRARAGDRARGHSDDHNPPNFRSDEPTAASADSIQGLDDGESVIADVAANLFRGIESVGGRLLISNRRLVFQSHKVNIQSGRWEVPMEQIAQVRTKNTLGVVPNGLLVTTIDGAKYHFVVWGRQKIMDHILKCMSRQ